MLFYSKLRRVLAWSDRRGGTWRFPLDQRQLGYRLAQLRARRARQPGSGPALRHDEGDQWTVVRSRLRRNEEKVHMSVELTLEPHI